MDFEKEAREREIEILAERIASSAVAMGGGRPDPMLTADIAKYVKDEILKASPDLSRAVEALRPFHKLHDDVLRGRGYVPDDAALVLTTLDGGIIDTSDRVQAGDLRRAREAYEQITKG